MTTQPDFGFIKDLPGQIHFSAQSPGAPTEALGLMGQLSRQYPNVFGSELNAAQGIMSAGTSPTGKSPAPAPAAKAETKIAAAPVTRAPGRKPGGLTI